MVNGQSILQFCSNDYLGIASHPVVTRAAEKALSRYGTGAGSARLVVGTSSPHCELERAIAQWKQTEAALALSSGYHANTGVLPALTESEDVIFSDALNHASIIDGCRLSHATTNIYRHNDVGHLTTLLSAAGTARRRFIVTESVFAMDGETSTSSLKLLNNHCFVFVSYTSFIELPTTNPIEFLKVPLPLGNIL